jgi:hypothetical protein
MEPSEKDHQRLLSDELRVEIERRKKRLDQNPESGVPWEVARERALKRLKR